MAGPVYGPPPPKFCLRGASTPASGPHAVHHSSRHGPLVLGLEVGGPVVQGVLVAQELGLS